MGEVTQVQYISLSEASQMLETNEKEIQELIDEGQLHAFRIGGEYLRLRQDQVSDVKAKWRINRKLFPEERGDKHILVVDKPNALEVVKDFLYFNDYYIICSFVIAALLYLIISAY